MQDPQHHRGHSRRELAGDGQLVAPLDAPVLLPLHARDGPRGLLGGDFVPGEETARFVLAGERSRKTSVWAPRPPGAAKRERRVHEWAGEGTIYKNKSEIENSSRNSQKVSQEH